MNFQEELEDRKRWLQRAGFQVHSVNLEANLMHFRVYRIEVDGIERELTPASIFNAQAMISFVSVGAGGEAHINSEDSLNVERRAVKEWRDLEWEPDLRF